jgi:enoyl-CoA hydratase
MDNLQDLILNVDDDKNIAVIQFNRPAKRNAFSQNTINELVAVLAHLDHLETVRAVVITGQPDGHFCGMLYSDLSSLCHAC